MSVSLSVSSVLCLSHSYALCSLHTCSNVCLSVLCPTHIFLFRLFCIHMLLYVSIYLSVTFIHTMSPIALLSFHLYSHNIDVCWLNVTICCSSFDCFSRFWLYVLAISTVVIILTQDCSHIVDVSVCCSRYDQHSCCFYHLWTCCKHRFEDAEFKNFASVDIVLPLFRRLLHTDPKTMTVCLSVSLSFVCLDMRTYSYASITFTNNLSRRRLMVGALRCPQRIVCAAYARSVGDS